MLALKDKHGTRQSALLERSGTRHLGNCIAIGAQRDMTAVEPPSFKPSRDVKVIVASTVPSA